MLTINISYICIRTFKTQTQYGHIYQRPSFVGSDYFCWVLENREMVVKAYKDSRRKCPFNPDLKKENWQQLIVNPAQYINVCWDANYYKVLQLEEIKKGRK